eukprot:11944227-Alexandrium_andersonii.AAC.1
MSASLVGSEMCIRDRVPAVSCRSLQFPALLSGGATTPPGPANARSGVPVSYTHLTLPTICSV